MTDALDRLEFARDLAGTAGGRHRLARDAVAGTAHRVARGAYISADVWSELGARERYLQQIAAIAYTRRAEPVLSHWSAAAVHGLPIVGGWPDKVHIAVNAARGGRSSGQVVRHPTTLRDDEVVEVDGFMVTSIIRTVLDMASMPDEMTSVALTDRVLHVDRLGRVAPLVTRSELVDAYSTRLPFRASARVRAVIDFAVEQSDSVLESVSRVNMRAAGIPRPVLQQRFDDYKGLIGWSEFYWPEFSLVGEADGRMKYLDPAYRSGRSLERFLYDEKVRADRLRALELGVSRWDWGAGRNREALRRHLVAAGLPTGRGW
jgi:hypothetical protein